MPYYIGDVKRDPNLESYPYVFLWIEHAVLASGLMAGSSGGSNFKGSGSEVVGFGWLGEPRAS